MESQCALPVQVLLFLAWLLQPAAAPVNFSPNTFAELSWAVDEWQADVSSAISKYGQITLWNTARITSMKKLFQQRVTFNEPIGTWNTANVKSMQSTFDGAGQFNQPIGNWDTSHVSDMKCLFKMASRFNQPIGTWNTAAVTLMKDTFLSATKFNHPIARWNTARVSNMNGMFEHAKAFNQPIGGWHIARVSQMRNVFRKAIRFNQPIGAWNTARVAFMDNLFDSARQFNQPLDSWDTGHVTEMFRIFYKTRFNQPIGSWNTARVANMTAMFMENQVFNQYIGNWNTASCDTMNNMFDQAIEFNQPIGSWNTARVTSMEGTFHYATGFNQPIANWNTGGVKRMKDMFGDTIAFNQPIGAWNTARVVRMDLLFEGARQFNQPLDSWNTVSCDSMEEMFGQAIAFNQPIGSWSTANVHSIKNIFRNANGFNQPIGSWKTARVTSMEGTFHYAIAFNQPIENWNTASVTTMTNMFHAAAKFNQPTAQWNISSVGNMNGIFVGAVSFCQDIRIWTGSTAYTSGSNTFPEQIWPACTTTSAIATTVTTFTTTSINVMTTTFTTSSSRATTTTSTSTTSLVMSTILTTTSSPRATTTHHVLTTTLTTWSSRATTTTSTSTTGLVMSTILTTTSSPRATTTDHVLTTTLTTCSSRATTTTSTSTTSLVRSTVLTTTSSPRATTTHAVVSMTWTTTSSLAIGTMFTTISNLVVATTGTTTNINRVVDGSLIVTVSSATRFVNEPNITIAMKIAIAELCVVNVSWIHNVAVSLVLDRRFLLLNTRFHGNEEHSMKGRSLSGADSADLTLWANPKVKIEFRIVIPESGVATISATTITETFDAVSLAAADFVINQVLNSGILGSHYGAKVVRKSVRVDSHVPALTPTAAPQPKALPKWWLIVAVIAVVSTTCPCIIFCVLKLQPYTDKHPSETVPLEKSVAEWAIMELLNPPDIITKDMHKELQSRAAGLAWQVGTGDHEVFIAFSLGQRKGDAEDTGPGFFYALALALTLGTHGVPCCLSPLGCGDGDNSDVSFENHHGIMMLVVVETPAFYRCAQCLRNIHRALKNNTGIIRMRFEDNVPHAQEWWPDMVMNLARDSQTRALLNVCSASWFEMREFVLERLNLISPCPSPPCTVGAFEGLMGEFAVDMKSRLMMISSKNSMALVDQPPICKKEDTLEDGGHGIPRGADPGKEITILLSSSLLLPNSTPSGQPRKKQKLICVEPLVSSGKRSPQPKNQFKTASQSSTEVSELIAAPKRLGRRTHKPQKTNTGDAVACTVSANVTEGQQTSGVGPGSNPIQPVCRGRGHPKARAKGTSRKITNNVATNADAAASLSSSIIGRPGAGSNAVQPVRHLRSHPKARAKNTSRKITNNGAAISHVATTIPASIIGHREVSTLGSAQTHSHEIQLSTSSMAGPTMSQKPTVRNRRRGRPV